MGANKWEGEDEDEDVKVRGSKTFFFVNYFLKCAVCNNSIQNVAMSLYLSKASNWESRTLFAYCTDYWQTAVTVIVRCKIGGLHSSIMTL